MREIVETVGIVVGCVIIIGLIEFISEPEKTAAYLHRMYAAAQCVVQECAR